MIEVQHEKSVHGRSVLDLIGNTPLLGFKRVTRSAEPVEIYAKAEWYNPGGSVKDRAALAMIIDGERRGLLTPKKTIVDATSGNTGIALAMFGAALGYGVKLCLPHSASAERKQILEAYGAELVFTPADEGSDGAIRSARKLAAEDPHLYFYADQYSNDANWRAHYDGTALEIWEQTRGRVTHFCAGLGTSGTFVGITRRLKEFNRRVRCISLQPDSGFHGLEGWKHMPTAIVPRIYDPYVADENLEIRTEDAYRMAKRLAREEGLLASPSSAAAMCGALAVASELPPSQRAVIVTIFPDSGEKYLSERFWSEA